MIDWTPIMTAGIAGASGLAGAALGYLTTTPWAKRTAEHTAERFDAPARPELAASAVS